MRLIGKGQTLRLLIPPGVAALIDSHASLVGSILPSRSLFSQQQPQQQQLGLAAGCTVLGEICGWLVARQIRHESLQHRLLCLQSACNVWRKAALGLLKQAHASLGTDQVSPQTQQALSLFLEPVDFAVSSTIPVSAPLSQRLRQMALQHEELLHAAEAAEVATTAATATTTGTVSRGRALLDRIVAQLEAEEAAARRQAARGDTPETDGDALQLGGLEAEIEGEEQQQQEEEQVRHANRERHRQSHR